jgi:hypothetical protein
VFHGHFEILVCLKEWMHEWMPPDIFPVLLIANIVFWFGIAALRGELVWKGLVLAPTDETPDGDPNPD